jgi:m7GpppX diphosphatase
VERIVFEDEDREKGFVMLPDMKWDGKTVNTMCLLAIVHRRDLNSMRDLDGSHLELLENIRDKCLKAVEEKFDVRRDKVRLFLHYQPTFYHLHVHVNHLNHTLTDMPERNFSLNQIIENLKLDSDYYKKVAVEYVVRKNEMLYDLFKDRFEQ